VTFGKEGGPSLNQLVADTRVSSRLSATQTKFNEYVLFLFLTCLMDSW